jgi:hypothetical protein
MTDSYRVARIAVVDVCVGDVTNARRHTSDGVPHWRAPVKTIERRPYGKARHGREQFVLTFEDGSVAGYPDTAYVKIKIERPS